MTAKQFSYIAAREMNLKSEHTINLKFTGSADEEFDFKDINAGSVTAPDDLVNNKLLTIDDKLVKRSGVNITNETELSGITKLSTEKLVTHQITHPSSNIEISTYSTVAPSGTQIIKYRIRFDWLEEAFAKTYEELPAIGADDILQVVGTYWNGVEPYGPNVIEYPASGLTYANNAEFFQLSSNLAANAPTIDELPFDATWLNVVPVGVPNPSIPRTYELQKVFATFERTGESSTSYLYVGFQVVGDKVNAGVIALNIGVVGRTLRPEIINGFNGAWSFAVEVRNLAAAIFEVTPSTWKYNDETASTVKTTGGLTDTTATGRVEFKSVELPFATQKLILSGNEVYHGYSVSNDKIHFWEGTPISKITTTSPSATFNAGGADIVHTDSHFDGYTIGQIVRALRDFGLLQ